jgi:GNAT superfamily N-acetyltransferase
MAANNSVFHFVEITGDDGAIVQPLWLTRAEAVHRQLRTGLPTDYIRRLSEVFANGARMCVAIKGDKVLGVAVWRLIENTYEGRRLYVDDLVTDETHRSHGVGKGLLNYLEERAHLLGCNVLALDSGSQRTRAHAFYFREGMHIPSFCFKKELS